MRNITETRAMQLDILSVILSAVGFSGLIYGLSSLGEAARGWRSFRLIPLVIGGTCLIIFVLRQLTRPERFSQHPRLRRANLRICHHADHHFLNGHVRYLYCAAHLHPTGPGL